MKKWNDEYNACMFAEKHWVKNINGEIQDCVSYQQGTFPAVYCIHDGTFCECDVDGCIIKQDHDNE